MRLLVVGSGGREHALVEALAQSPRAEEIFAAPGNPGMASVAELVDIPVDDLISLRNFARTVGVDLTIVGPEAPLVGGIAEAFWEAGLKVFGPSRAAARIEGSKIFAKKIMQHAGVPTARSEVFDREAAALAYLRSLPPGDGYPVVVKVDGLAAGKGVIIADSYEEAEDAVRARPGLQAPRGRRRGPEHGGYGGVLPDDVDGLRDLHDDPGGDHKPHHTPARSHRRALHGPPVRRRHDHGRGTEGA